MTIVELFLLMALFLLLTVADVVAAVALWGDSGIWIGAAVTWIQIIGYALVLEGIAKRVQRGRGLPMRHTIVHFEERGTAIVAIVRSTPHWLARLFGAKTFDRYVIHLPNGGPRAWVDSQGRAVEAQVHSVVFVEHQERIQRRAALKRIIDLGPLPALPDQVGEPGQLSLLSEVKI